MTDVIVTSLDWGKPGGDRPTANVTLDYRTIEIQQNTTSGSNDTATHPTWNITQNKPTP